MASQPPPLEGARSPMEGRKSLPFDLHKLGADWIVGSGLATFQKTIEKSPNDKNRQYRLITLANGLEALLISDSTTDKAAASLVVGVGHLKDPDDLPGLAHFCEHMLFLGTSKFPAEADYKDYLSKSGGSSNASTSADETNYHFTCLPHAFEGALLRHSQFFTTPLFLPSCTTRELKAVDSEFRRNLQLDSRRLYVLGKSTSNREKGSVYWKFGTGNIETLDKEPREMGVDVRERLLEWYKKNYSANRMKLAVLSNQSLDELQSWVKEKYSDIPNLNNPEPIFDVLPLTPKELQLETSYRTIKDTPQLRIDFPFPDSRHWWMTKPGRYISHFIGHEGKGSVLADLKERGWATSLSSGANNGAAGFDIFRVDISLTPFGLVEYKKVLQILFAYIQLLKATPPIEWAFNEMRTLGSTSWAWKENGDPTSAVKNHASQLHSLYPKERILVGGWFAEKFDKGLIERCLREFREENCRIALGSKEELEGKVWDLKERYYGTEYCTVPLEFGPSLPPQTFDELALPHPNPFVPSRLELLPLSPEKTRKERPTLIQKTSTSRVFWKPDDTWRVPRATAYFRLKSGHADESPRSAMMTQLFTSLVEDALSEYSYDASLAGLDYSVGTEADGIEVVVSGYNDKLSTLLEVVLRKMKEIQISPARFELIYDRLRRAYANASLQNPSSLVDIELRHLTRQTHWSYADRLDALKGITPTAVQIFGSVLLKELQIVSLVHGNVSKEEALSFSSLVSTILQCTPADTSLNDYHRALLLPTSSDHLYRIPVPSSENVNSTLNVYYQISPTSSPSHHLICQLRLFAQIASVPIFSTLRTKEQLGYIVQSGTWISNREAGFRVKIQSEKIGEFLEERVEEFWRGFGAYLEDMKEEDFEKQRESLALKRLEKVKNLGQETTRYWDEISSGDLDFFQREREASIIRTLTKSDLINFFTTFISPSSSLPSSRTKLSIIMRSQRFQSDALQQLYDLIQPLVATEAAEEVKKVLLEDKPTSGEVRKLLEKHLGESGKWEESIKKEFEALELLPELKEGVVEIEAQKMEQWRKTLKRGEPVQPVEDVDKDLIETIARL